MAGVALLALVVAARVGAAAISVSASVESTDVAAGEPFMLTISVDGAQNVPVPVVEVKGMRADYIGPSTQVSFVNGRMSASVTHRYRMIADDPGQYTLGPFVIGYEDQRYQTKPISMRVRPAGTRQAAGAATGNPSLRLVVQPTRSEVYLGERIEVLLTLYVGEVRVRDLQYPVIHADGVTVEKFSQPDQGSEVVDGKRYTTVRLRTHLTPVRAGPIDLRTTMTVTVLGNRRGFDSFFDQILPGDAKQVEIQAEPSQVTVLPLPEEGRPADFTGAVGTFQFDLTAKPTEVQAGDPITLRMEVRGSGNPASVTPPALPATAGFRRYDPQAVKDEDGEDRRVFEQVVIPSSVDIREIPALRFSYFDPDARAYETITRGPLPIQVRAAAAGRAAVVDAAAPAPPTPIAEAPLGRDIVYIKEAPGTFHRRAAGGSGTWWALLLALPVAMFASTRAWVRRGERLASDPRRVRFRAAGRQAQRALAAARLLGGRERVDASSAALTAYLAAKLDLPPGGVERDRVVERLAAGGVADAVRAEVARFFALAEEARYAGGAGAAADGVVDTAERIVAALERERRLEARLGAWLALLLGAALLTTPARADDVPATAFYAGNEAYAAGRYDEAIASYQRARGGGVDSGALEFNLGNAFMKRGDIGRAIASYERAARLLPRDPDVGANLAFARERANLEPAGAPVWQRVFAPFAHRATTAELATMFAALWWGFWALLVARLLWPAGQGALARAAIAAAVLAGIVALSLVVRVGWVERPGAAVVVAAGDTPVRFEPTANGTEHFIVTAGVDVSVREERDGWLLIARADGRRGWIPADAVERVD
ncbi:BatD family protein [bacterium]|nr:BatD family protein [bacterium]